VMNLFDHYSCRARLQPALLTLAPLALGAFAWAPPGARWPSVIWSLLGTVGLTFFLAIATRNRGKSIEPGLWTSWGGTPTTQLLRYSGPANPVLRERWHKQLAKLLGKSLPTAEEEKDNPTHADKIYEAATRLLIDKARDRKKFPLVYAELVNYGFCRNLYGVRWLGFSLALIGFVSSLAANSWSVNTTGKESLLPWGCGIVCFLFLLCWIFVVKSAWVKVPAMSYAHRLFESSEKLSRSKAGTKIDGP
jgi:hypothetical protein